MALSDRHEELLDHAFDIGNRKSELNEYIAEFEAKKKALIKEIIDAVAELLSLLKAVKKTKH